MRMTASHKYVSTKWRFGPPQGVAAALVVFLAAIPLSGINVLLKDTIHPEVNCSDVPKLYDGA